MTDLLPAWPLLSAFLTASFILAITPGPGVFYIVTRSMAQGRAAGLASVAGVALGNIGNVCGASLGLAALFALSPFAFWGVKYAGAAYLVYLGLQALRSKPAVVSDGAPPSVVPLARLFRDGFVVALLNPKTALFFAAFLPQFMHSTNPSIAQSLMLGGLFVLIAAVTDSLYALAAGSIAPILKRAGSAQSYGKYFVAAAFIGLGLLVAF